MTTSIRISPAVLLNMLLPGRSDIELEGVCLEHEPGFGERLVLHADIPGAPEGDCVLTINTFDTIGGGRAHVLSSIDPVNVPTRTPAPMHPRKAIAALMALETFFDRSDEALAAALILRLRSYVEDGRPAAFGLAGIFAEGGVFTGGVGNGGGVMGEHGPEAILPNKRVNLTYVSDKTQAARIAAHAFKAPACKCPGAKDREHLPDCPIFAWEANDDPHATLERVKQTLAPIHRPECASVVTFGANCDCDLAKPPCAHVFCAVPGDKHAECKECGSKIAILWSGDSWFVRDVKARIEPPSRPAEDVARDWVHPPPAPYSVEVKVGDVPVGTLVFKAGATPDEIRAEIARVFPAFAAAAAGDDDAIGRAISFADKPPGPR